VPRITVDLGDESGVPYFLTDLAITLRRFKEALRDGPEATRDALLARLLADARPPDVWKFTTPQRVWERWDRIAPRLGWSRPMWSYLFECWRRDGLVR
jgi:hypothetical protein